MTHFGHLRDYLISIRWNIKLNMTKYKNEQVKLGGNMNNKYNLQKNRQLNFSKNVEKLRKKWNELPNATSLLLKTLK